MPPTNEFLPFCPTDTGSNLIPQADYSVATGRSGGQVPGIASSALNNKAVRQATFVSAQLAQLASNITGTDTLDDANNSKFLAQLSASLVRLAPMVDAFLSGSGSYNLRYVFFLSSGSATVGAIYTNNSITYTVIATVASASKIILSGNGAPLNSGTLTKTGGTGDSTITFFAVRAPSYLKLVMVGGGGGGGAGGLTSTITPTAGTNSTFGSNTAGLGLPGVNGTNTGGVGGAGGAATLASGFNGIAVSGGNGGGSSATQATAGMGGGSALGGNGGASQNQGADNATAGQTNTGSGGGGGPGLSGTAQSGSGGGAGGYINAICISPAATYSFSVGAAGIGGSGAGTGGAGGSGAIWVESHY